MAIPDPMAALRSHLVADATVNSLTSGRVYVDTMPRDDAGVMPRGAVVIRAAGGPLDRGTLAVHRIRVDVRCYGNSAGAVHPYTDAVPASMALWLAVFDSLKRLNRSKQSTALLHSATPSGGPVSLREPEADWPFVFGSFEVNAAEVAAA